MHKMLLLAGLTVSTLSFATHAQVTPGPTAAPPPPTAAPPTNTPPADGGMPSATPAPPPASEAPPPPPPAAGGMQPTMAPSSPVVQNAPQPPADYPVCGKDVTDGCVNAADARKARKAR